MSCLCFRVAGRVRRSVQELRGRLTADKQSRFDEQTELDRLLRAEAITLPLRKVRGP